MTVPTNGAGVAAASTTAAAGAKPTGRANPNPNPNFFDGGVLAVGLACLDMELNGVRDGGGGEAGEATQVMPLMGPAYRSTGPPVHRGSQCG